MQIYGFTFTFTPAENILRSDKFWRLPVKNDRGSAKKQLRRLSEFMQVYIVIFETYL